MAEYADIVVVGAGPAGMEAAATAAGAGALVAIIDRYPSPGGQYFRRIPERFVQNEYTSNDKQANNLLRKIRSPRIRLFSSTVAWNIEKASASGQALWRLFLAGDGAPGEIVAKAVILATGAHERLVAFPGWTLPGVFTAGAVQAMIKGQRVLPGKRFVVSGTGPLQLAAAAQLVWAGAEVVGVYESARPGLAWLPHIPALWGQWSRFAEGFSYIHALKKAGVPYQMGRTVIEARGSEQVEEIVTARVDKRGNPVTGSEQIFSADTLVIGYGFQPLNDLARLLGCIHDFCEDTGGFVIRRNDGMETTVRGVFSAGDGSAIGGAVLARIEGRIAGNSAACQLGFISDKAMHETWLRERSALKRERRFACFLAALFAPGPGLYGLARKDTVICRCEDITLGEIENAIDAGCSSMALVKRLTRAGMGSCQGHVCGQLVEKILERKAGIDPARMQRTSVRAPVFPVPFRLMDREGSQ